MNVTPWALANCGLFSMEHISGSASYGNPKTAMKFFLISWSHDIKSGITRTGAYHHLKAHRCLFSLASRGYDFSEYSSNPGIAFLIRYSQILWQGTNTSHGDRITTIFLMDLRPLVGTLIDDAGNLLPARHMSYRFRKFFSPQELADSDKRRIYKVKIKRKRDGGNERKVLSKKLPPDTTYGKITYLRVKDYAKTSD